MTYWEIVVPVVLFVGLFLFRLITAPYELAQKDAATIKSLRTTLDAIERDKIKFDIQIVKRGIEIWEPENINIGAKVFCIQLINLHKTRRAKNVRIWISKMTVDDSADGLCPFEGTYEIPVPADDLPPGKVTDFKFVYFQFQEEDSYILGLAPFNIEDYAQGPLSVGDDSKTYLEGNRNRQKPILFTLIISAEDADSVPLKLALHIPTMEEELKDVRLDII